MLNVINLMMVVEQLANFYMLDMHDNGGASINTSNGDGGQA